MSVTPRGTAGAGARRELSMNMHAVCVSAPARNVVGALVLAGVFFALRPMRAQEPSPPQRASYYGGWTLNKDLSASGPTPDGGERGGRGRRGPGGGFGGPGGGRGGPGGGFGGPAGGGPGGPGGGLGGPRGGFGGPGGRNFDPQKMDEAMAVMREVMTPTTRWMITGEAGVVTLTDADGRSSRYTTDGKKEKHQLSNAAIETKSRWENGQLRQELSLPAGMKALRVFAVVQGETPQLVVTVSPQGGPEGRAGRRPPLRFVYDRDAGSAR